MATKNGGGAAVASAPKKTGSKKAGAKPAAKAPAAKDGPVEAAPVAANQPTAAEVAESGKVAAAEAEAIKNTEAAVAAGAGGNPLPEPPKPQTMDPRTALDLTLTKAVRQVILLEREVADADRVRAKSRTVLERMGIDVPEDGADDGDPVAAAAATPARTNGSAEGGLWGIFENHLFTNGFIEPKFETAANLHALASKHNYTTAANMLSQSAKAKKLAKGGRGEYALPKGYKRSKK